MIITVFGASGQVGRLVVDELLSRGHTVMALAHNTPLKPRPKLEIIMGDIYKAADIARAIKGSEAVISTLGSWGTPGKDVTSAAMLNIVPAMQAARTKRIVSLTGHGANAPGDRPNPIDIVSRLILKLLAAKILADGEKQIKLLDQSDLDWTVIRSPIMRNHKKHPEYRLTTKRPWPLAVIDRGAVAKALVDLAVNDNYGRQAPFIAKR